MPRQIRPPAQALQGIRLNGEAYKQLDPAVIKLAEFLDRAIRTQNVTVGLVMSAIGIVLGRKVMSPGNLEHMAHDIKMAMKVGYYLAQQDRGSK